LKRGSISVASVALGAACLACAGARGGLPPAPPQKSASELVAWQTPPPLELEPPLHVDWDVARERLASGLGINVVSRSESTVTSVMLWVPSAADRSNGPVAVMGEALRAGTRARGGGLLFNPKLAEREVSVLTTGTGTLFTWQVLPRATRTALELLSDFVARPAFDPDATHVQFQQALAAIQRYSGTTTHVSDLARSAIGGIAIQSPEQDARGLLSLTPALLGRVHACAVSPRGAELIVVGPGSAPELSDAARDAFETFAPRAPDPSCANVLPPPLPPPEAASHDRLELQIIYGISDPWLVVVVPGPAPASEDHLPFTLLAEVLESRDSGAAKLRHMGATYGLRARVNDGFPGRSLLEVQGQVAPENTQTALRTLVEDIRGLAETLDDAELDRVKRRWRSRFINSLSNNFAVGLAVLDHIQRGHPADAIGGFPDELGRVSIERCREVARRWLSRAAPSIAVAGMPVKLVKGLGLGARVRELYWTDRLQEQKKAL